MDTQFVTADNDWQDEKTTYWFSLTGSDDGTGHEFDGDIFGICETGPESSVVDADRYPLTVGDALELAVRRHCVVTDAMRRELSGGKA